jgi:hypothetical protein
VTTPLKVEEAELLLDDDVDDAPPELEPPEKPPDPLVPPVGNELVADGVGVGYEVRVGVGVGVGVGVTVAVGEGEGLPEASPPSSEAVGAGTL